MANTYSHTITDHIDQKRTELSQSLLWIAVFCSISSTTLMSLGGSEQSFRLLAFLLCVPSNLIWIVKGIHSSCAQLCCWNTILLTMNMIGFLKCYGV